jgi:hypothetical protein
MQRVNTTLQQSSLLLSFCRPLCAERCSMQLPCWQGCPDSLQLRCNRDQKFVGCYLFKAAKTRWCRFTLLTTLTLVLTARSSLLGTGFRCTDNR